MENKDKGMFARKLEKLFKNIRKPDGSEYTEVEVQVGAENMGEKITHAYVYRLREGLSRNPSYEKIRALARFFGVSPAYFFEDDAEDAVLNELADPASKESGNLDLDSIAMRAEEVEDEAVKDTILRMLLAIKETREQVQRGRDEIDLVDDEIE